MVFSCTKVRFWRRLPLWGWRSYTPAVSILPLLAGSRFDFKVEFDGKVNEKDVRVLINGKPAESVLGGKPEFVP